MVVARNPNGGSTSPSRVLTDATPSRRRKPPPRRASATQRGGVRGTAQAGCRRRCVYHRASSGSNSGARSRRYLMNLQPRVIELAVHNGVADGARVGGGDGVMCAMRASRRFHDCRDGGGDAQLDQPMFERRSVGRVGPSYRNVSYAVLLRLTPDPFPLKSKRGGRCAGIGIRCEALMVDAVVRGIARTSAIKPSRCRCAPQQPVKQR